MSLASVLVGHTGFVGGTLLRQAPFDATYHSATIGAFAGQTVDLLVCAGVRAEKWRANADPAADWAGIERLLRVIATVHAREAILVSTVDVYPAPDGVDEADPIAPDAGHAYGRHRLAVEAAFTQRFPTLVVRLPGLFGRGLKKNAVYDLLHDHQVERIDPRGRFQFYGLDTLWADVQRARAAGLTLVNFATEPVSMREVAATAFDQTLAGEFPGPAARYDVRSRHAAVFGGADGYLQSRAQVLDALAAFVRAERAGAPAASALSVPAPGRS